MGYWHLLLTCSLQIALIVQSSKKAPSKPIFKKLQRLTILDIYKMQVVQLSRIGSQTIS